MQQLILNTVKHDARERGSHQNFMQLGSELERVEFGAGIRGSNVPCIDLREVQSQESYYDSEWEKMNNTIARSLPSAPLHDHLWSLGFKLVILRQGGDDCEFLKGPCENMGDAC